MTVQIEVKLSYKSVNEWEFEDRTSHTMQNNAIKIAVNVIHTDINTNMNNKWTIKEMKFKSKQSFRTKDNIFTSKITKKKKTSYWWLAKLKNEIKFDFISILNKKVIQVNMMQYININLNIKIFISKTFKLKFKLIIMKTIKFKMMKMIKNKQT